MSQSVVQSALSGPQYDAWLAYHSELPGVNGLAQKTTPAWSKLILAEENHGVITTALTELSRGLEKLYGVKPSVSHLSDTKASERYGHAPAIRIGTWTGSDSVAASFSETERSAVLGEGYIIRKDETEGVLVIGSETPQGVLYGTFHLLREPTLDSGSASEAEEAVGKWSFITEQPTNAL
ncbi:alpha-glucuronidase family glycosyl hydrolase, partial [Paenibacillus sp.]